MNIRVISKINILSGYLELKTLKLYLQTEVRNVTRISAWKFPVRYKEEAFHGLTRAEFLKALRAEGIPASTGYVTQNDKPYLKNTFESKNYRRMYTASELDFDQFLERNRCPENDLLCSESVWFNQNMLLGSKTDMDDIAAAIEKVYNYAAKIKG